MYFSFIRFTPAITLNSSQILLYLHTSQLHVIKKNNPPAPIRAVYLLLGVEHGGSTRSRTFKENRLLFPLTQKLPAVHSSPVRGGFTNPVPLCAVLLTGLVL